MFGGLRSRLLLVSEPHRRLFRNRSFVLLWSGQSASVFGDAFFNLAVMWVVWSETQSTLMTAIVQAIWHIPDVLFAPLAGVLADRWDRKAIMVSTNVAAAAVVGAVVVVIVVVGHLPPVVAFVAVFKLNSLTTFLNPARASVMPSVVGRDLLTTAQGLFSTARETASLVGSGVAGLLIAVASVAWALVIDAASFLFRVAVHRARARLPGRPAQSTALNEARPRLSARSVVRDLRDGWRTASRAAGSPCIAMARRVHQRRRVHRAVVAGPGTGEVGRGCRLPRHDHGGGHCGRDGWWAAGRSRWSGVSARAVCWHRAGASRVSALWG